MSEPRNFDLIVIGAGPGGMEAVSLALAEGLEVLMVERDLIGGTCLNRGCIPTKALCRTASLALDIARAGELGFDCPENAPAPSWPKAIERKDAIVTELREGAENSLGGAVRVSGEARFTAPHEIEVEGERYTAPRIIVATGSRPARLPIPGAELALDSTALLSLPELPSSAIVIGGGVIGLEMASVMSAMGCGVTILEYCSEILPGFDTEIAKRLRMLLKRRGISVVTSAAVNSIAKEGDTLKVSYADRRGREQTAEAALVLMSTGRCPVIPDGLAELGAAIERGALVTDDRMMTNIDGVYALGDVNGRCMLAHAASAQARVAMGKYQPLIPVPSAVFTVPECSMVGLTEQQCLDSDLDFTVGRATFHSNGKALAMGEPDGLVKALVERTTRRLLGVHICGPHAADLIAEPTLAMTAGLPATAIAAAIHAHPTLSEALTAAIFSAL